jgi:AraC-like DNA-binding protein
VRVIVLFGSRRDRLRIAESLAGSAAVAAADDLAEATRALGHPDARACIVCVTPERVAVAIAAIGALRAAFPSRALIAWCDLHELDRPSLVATIRAGASDLLFRGIDDGRTVARHALANAVRGSCAADLLRDLQPTVPADLLPFLRHGLHTPAAADELDATAAALGMARRTLAKRLALLGAPPPRRFFSWTRLLLAGALLAEPGRTLQAVALELGFESTPALRLQLRRYAGVIVTSSSARRQLPATLRRAFAAELAAGRASLAAPSAGASSSVSRGHRASSASASAAAARR